MEDLATINTVGKFIHGICDFTFKFYKQVEKTDGIILNEMKEEKITETKG